MFCSNKQGNVGILFGVMVVPVIAFSGAALDYSRASNLRSALQLQADTIALNVAVNGREHEHAQIVAGMVAEFRQNYGGGNAITDLSVSGDWISDIDFRVAASGRIDTMMIHILPGVEAGIDVGTEAVARIGEEELQYEPPVLFELEPDAGDYNQIYAYCFKYDEQMSNPQQNHRLRSQMTLIADNDGNQYDFDWPECGKGESLSFRMRNVRHARAYPELWDDRSLPPYRAEFDFYTDTVIANGREYIDVVREIEWVPPQWRDHYAPGSVDRGYDIVETIRCDSLEECKGESQGGIIPEGRHRTPRTETRACEPGKYMYYGWEDRPPHQPGPAENWTKPAWTDRDFDDIRIVMRCPTSGAIGDRTVRLIR